MGSTLDTLSTKEQISTRFHKQYFFRILYWFVVPAAKQLDLTLLSVLVTFAILRLFYFFHTTLVAVTDFALIGLKKTF